MIAAALSAVLVAAGLEADYRVEPDLVYRSSAPAALDVYWRPQTPEPRPVVVYLHGGGWMGGSKEGATLQLLPWLAAGFDVVNVGYRLGSDAPAPAAAVDARCALRWVVRNADRFRFDPARIVLAGHSAGGHLALVSALGEGQAWADPSCEAGAPARAAAVVNFFGITDVADVLSGAGRRDWAERWFKGVAPEPLSRALSPLYLARADSPPVFTVHGDADPIVPYAHAARLHERLRALGVPNRLLTVAGGSHGAFSAERSSELYAEILAFLGAHGVPPPASSRPQDAAGAARK